MQSLGTLIATLAGGYLLLVLLLFFMQGRLLYMPHKTLIATPEAIGLAYEDLTLHTSDGVRLHGWFIPANGEGTLLFFHGNAGNLSHRLESIRIFHGLGLNVLIVDYRGYGLSGGRPGHSGLMRDAQAAWDYLTQERGISPAQIVLFGRSLGAAVAAELAANTPAKPAAVILESAFTSAADLGSEIYPWLPVRALLRHPHETARHLGAINEPLLLIHSREDEIIPFSHHERLRTIRPDAATLELKGGHNDGFLVSQTHYIEGLRRFLE